MVYKEKAHTDFSPEVAEELPKERTATHTQDKGWEWASPERCSLEFSDSKTVQNGAGIIIYVLKRGRGEEFWECDFPRIGFPQLFYIMSFSGCILASDT